MRLMVDTRVQGGRESDGVSKVFQQSCCQVDPARPNPKLVRLTGSSLGVRGSHVNTSTIDVVTR